MELGHDIAMALRHAYWAMHRQADACLQPLGVTANQYVLLALLDAEDAVTQRTLVDRASSDPNTVRAMLLALEKKRLIQRSPHPTDGRALCVRLSPRGKRVFKKLRAGSDSFRRRLEHILPGPDAEELLRLLGRISDAMTPPDSKLSEGEAAAS